MIHVFCYLCRDLMAYMLEEISGSSGRMLELYLDSYVVQYFIRDKVIKINKLLSIINNNINIIVVTFHLGKTTRIFLMGKNYYTLYIPTFGSLSLTIYT